MAVTDFYVDPDTGDDASLDGTNPSTPFETLAGLLNNETNPGGNVRINIRNTAAISYSSPITSAVTTFWSSSPTQNSKAIIRGVDENDDPHPNGTYTEITFTGTAEFLLINGYDSFYWEGIKIFQQEDLTSDNALVRLDVDCHFVNCHFERDDTGVTGTNGEALQLDGGSFIINSYFRCARNSNNGAAAEMEKAKVFNSVFVVENHSTSSNAAALQLSGSDSHVANSIAIVEGSGGGTNGFRSSNQHTRITNCTALAVSSDAGRNSGIRMEGDYPVVALNYVEGFAGSGGIGYEIQSTANLYMMHDNVSFNNATHYSDSGTNPLGDGWGNNEELTTGSTRISKSGDYNSWGNAFTYCTPEADIDNEEISSSGITFHRGAVAPAEAAPATVPDNVAMLTQEPFIGAHLKRNSKAIPY